MSTATPALPDRVADILRCPICADGVELVGASLRCGQRHTFDLARQGYVNLLGHAPGDNADDADMVRARAEFLDAGHYGRLACVLGELAAELGADGGMVLDAGAGTGYYLAAVLDRLPHAVGLAMDISKFGLRRAARAHPRAGAVVWDVWRDLPVPDDSCSLVLNVFAPRNGAEFARVLQPDAALVVVTPTRGHLAEVAFPLRLLSVDERKEQRLERALSAHFRLDHTAEHTFDLTLSAADVTRAALMGPAAHHVDRDELHRRVDALDTPLHATASFTVSVYRPLRAKK